MYPKFLFPGKTDKDPSQVALRVPCEYIVDPLNPFTWWKVFFRIRRDRSQIALLQWWVPYWTPSLAVISHLVKRYTSTKIVYICHNVTPHEESGTLDHRLAWVVLKRGDAFIVHSEQDRRKLRALLPQAVVWHAKLPIFNIFEKDEMQSIDVQKLRREFGLENKRVLLFFGFVRPYKGLEYAIQALPLVQSRYPDAHLLVVGEFWSSKEQYLWYAREAGVLDSITIIDRYVPNEAMAKYFALADVVVLPYVSATQSGVVQVAFHFGVPVITTRVGGLHEVVKDGYNGFVVPPQDESALAAAIVRYFGEDKKSVFSENIKNDCSLGRYSWDELINILTCIANDIGAT